MEKYLRRGRLGYHGKYTNDDKNSIVMKINKLVDEYNKKINSFNTEIENNIFHQTMINKIKNLE
jgi:hypothetical protein